MPPRLLDHHYQTWTLPAYVKAYFGGGLDEWRDLRMVRLARGVYSLYHTVTGRALWVVAPTSAAARDAFRTLVCTLDPQTDTRRRHWYYT